MTFNGVVCVCAYIYIYIIWPWMSLLETPRNIIWPKVIGLDMKDRKKNICMWTSVLNDSDVIKSFRMVEENTWGSKSITCNPDIFMRTFYYLIICSICFDKNNFWKMACFLENIFQKTDFFSHVRLLPRKWVRKHLLLFDLHW